ncbi:MAG: glutamine--fructose-6-phosphate transaminase (isomerizing) [bacterium]|nr:glutamine--fructose-6-phosphate transaminase (isomerizing) [bacterium]
MCGIFGVTNDPDAAQTILAGLKRLEYRGYDSWGIAVKDHLRLKLEKHVGKISLSRTHLPSSHFGVGHTRWATHGGVTQANSHPHLDCSGKLAIVHNGIVDNWATLKKELKGHHLSSQTDSEIIAHLIERELPKGDLLSACQKTFKRLQGLNAIIVFHQDYPYLVAAKSGSPLVIGVNPGNHLISSDTASLLPLTNKVIYLEDNQIAQIFPDLVKIMSLTKQSPIKPRINIINWQAKQADKGKFAHFMLKEIYEQSQIIDLLARSKLYETEQLAKRITQADQVFTVACGTAFYAALAGQYFFSRIAKRQIIPAIGSEFYYHADFLNKKSLLIALSQSGETIDTVQSIQHAQKAGCRVIGLVNVPGSTISRLSNQTLLLEAGPEKAVASTKAFLAKLAILLLTAHQLRHQPQVGQDELHQAARVVRRVLHPDHLSRIRALSRKIVSAGNIFVLGKGQSYPAALEIALKIKEISYIHAEGVPSGELKHGPIALIQKGTPCLVLAPDDETYADIISSALEVKARGAYVIGLSPRNNPVFDYWLAVPDCSHASIIPHVVVGQLLAYYLAVKKGFDPDMPRNLAKSVTVK